ncbi:MAG TPA: hypothetical protein VG144_12310 [Gaiellaceae bacterium]|nr:hypothetical protein [Gaiellaceae bacterium]
MNPETSHGIVKTLASSSSRPAKIGLKTAGPRIAPKTAPIRTYAMPRARRDGGYMSPAAVRTSREIPADEPISANPTTTATPESAHVP